MDSSGALTVSLLSVSIRDLRKGCSVIYLMCVMSHISILLGWVCWAIGIADVELVLSFD